MTILQRLKALENGQVALKSSHAALVTAQVVLAGRVSVLETLQAGDEENETAFAKELTGLRTDLTALAKLVGESSDVVVPKPGPVTILLTSEIEGELGMADAFVFDAKVEQTDHTDIVTSRITVVGPDGTEQVKETGVPVIDADGKHYSTGTGFTGSQGDSVTVRTVNLDDADPPNESEVSEETLTLRDTKSPQKAGAVTLVVTGEIDA